MGKRTDWPFSLLLISHTMCRRCIWCFTMFEINKITITSGGVDPPTLPSTFSAQLHFPTSPPYPPSPTHQFSRRKPSSISSLRKHLLISKMWLSELWHSSGMCSHTVNRYTWVWVTLDPNHVHLPWASVVSFEAAVQMSVHRRILACNVALDHRRPLNQGTWWCTVRYPPREEQRKV